MKSGTDNETNLDIRLLAELSDEPFILLNDAGNILFSSNLTTLLSGYSKSELTGMNIQELFSSYSSEQILQLQSPEGKHTVQKFISDIQRKNAPPLPVEIRHARLQDGSPLVFIRKIPGNLGSGQEWTDSERNYRKLFETIRDGYVYVNMQGTIIDSNRIYQEMLGYTPQELGQLTYQQLTPLAWHQHEQDILTNRILPDGFSPVYEKEYIHKNGTRFPVELRTFLVKDENGNAEGMWAIIRDITERKKYEEQLRISEEKFRTIVESSPTAMYFYELNDNDELILTGANPSSDRIIGISHTSLVGKPIEQAFPNLIPTKIPELYRDVARGNLPAQSFEITYSDNRFSGHYFVHVFRTNYKIIAVDFVDISARKQIEEALRRSEIEYRETLDSMNEWVYVVDKEFNFVVINKPLRNILSHSGLYDETILKRFSVSPPLFTEEDEVRIARIFETGKPDNYEKKLLLDRREYFVCTNMVPIHKDDSVEKVVVVLRDRSEDKEIEALKQKSADQKEILLREIHHRVKNNLSIVISLLSFQMDENPSPDLARTLIDIQTRIRAMALIHEHLYRSENLDRIPLADYIQSLTQMVSSTFSMHLNLVTLDIVAVDVSIETALPIGLIINELLTNAFKYAFPDGSTGHIHLEVLSIGNDQYRFTFSDNGIGMPINVTPEKSSSLGMYIVRLLTEQLDGTLEIIRDNGTRFVIVFTNQVRVRK
jgi:PAS domain S-box-containing protein